ncbi:hypothetical protein CMI42_04775 [Candidatus Pacearchaeota archaeon]|nr:hypothetical protein [Candidatus Pacearchaeota archaeon]|tara:strand:- start:147 stop:446 length:300 start_codon:yes stop_codon:yes gene_type:complete
MITTPLQETWNLYLLRTPKDEYFPILTTTIHEDKNPNLKIVGRLENLSEAEYRCLVTKQIGNKRLALLLESFNNGKNKSNPQQALNRLYGEMCKDLKNH